MDAIRKPPVVISGILLAVVMAAPGRAEDLSQAWQIALTVNQQVQAQRTDSVAAGLNAAAARAARAPTIQTFTFNSSLSYSPQIRQTLPVAAGSSGASGSSGAAGGTPITFPILGRNQHDIPFSFTSVNLPLYTGGRIRGGIDAARGQLGAQRASESRTVLELKLTVAEAYVGVLRAGRNLQVARSNVESLASFARDVKNRMDQGMATRNDQLAADVSLANARLREIRAINALDNAWSIYNRYLCRPLTQVVPLEEIAVRPDEARLDDLAGRAIRARPEFAGLDSAELQEMTARALGGRPELVGLSEQARALEGQATAARAGVRPQVSLIGGFVFLGSEQLIPQGNFAGTVLVNWTLFNAGASRRQSEAYRLRGDAALKRRADLAADIALQVRSQWLNLQEARAASRWPARRSRRPRRTSRSSATATSSR